MSSAAGSAQAQLHVFQDALERFRTDGLSAHDLSDLARGQSVLLAALPDKFSEVLHQLMDRLESSALFSEESCSFSQRDLVDSLQMWADKAAIRISNSPSA
ncbi:MAG: hypothetical protein EAZ54_00720 [Curvibacter sp.]|nr:MAG: hypothetical protein EAZ54_00720 [Curvibacter sp.]